MTWLPREKRDTAWWLMCKTYRCRVPNLQTMSPDYIRYFGTPDSGDEYTNTQMRDELIEVQIPVSTMAEYYAQDVLVILAGTQVAKEIYERIMDHLRLWKREMDMSLNPGTLPEIIDDLIKLDAFASALYPHARRFFEGDFIESKFARHIAGIVSITRDSFLPKEAKTGAAAEPDKHHGFSDAFIARRNTLSGRRWK
ncbi:hypothetical protein [Paraburkholderia sediminicola]|uniref:hypothetical protein n=1 Tax=Paraburkholderia sediminicola TaxID=458836 RepID=UPI0038BCD503